MIEFQIRVQQIARYLLAGAVVLLAAVPFIWAPGSLLLPAGGDQGVFIWVGEVILRGGLPYADAWEVKGPLTHFFYALALFVFGKTEAAIRYFDLIVGVIGVLAAARVGQVAGRTIWLGPIAFGLAMGLAEFNYWESAQPDGWAAIMLLWATVLIAQATFSGRAMFGSGVLLGLAVLIKPHYALFGILHLARIAMDPRKNKRPHFLLAVISGAALPIAICLLVFAAEGKLGALWNVFVLFNLEFHASKSPSTLHDAARQMFNLFFRTKMIVALVCAAIGCLSFRRSDRPLAVLLLLGTAIGFLIACIQAKFWVYHFLPFDLFLAVLAALGIASVVDSLGSTRKSAPDEPLLFAGAIGWAAERLSRIVPNFDWLCALASQTVVSSIFVVVLAEAITFVAVSTATQMRSPWLYAAGLMSEEEWQDQFCISGWGFCHRDIAEIAGIVKRQTEPGTPIFIWGLDALVYVLADRPAASRLYSSYAVLGGNADYQRRAQAELMSDLDRRKPAFIAVQTNESNDLIRSSSASHLPDFPALQNMIATQYVEASRNGSFILYRENTTDDVDVRHDSSE